MDADELIRQVLARMAAERAKDANVSKATNAMRDEQLGISMRFIRQYDVKADTYRALNMYQDALAWRMARIAEQDAAFLRSLRIAPL